MGTIYLCVFDLVSLTNNKSAVMAVVTGIHVFYLAQYNNTTAKVTRTWTQRLVLAGAIWDTKPQVSNGHLVHMSEHAKHFHCRT